MANKEILLVVDVVSNEKEIDKEVIFEAVESALAMATMKRHSSEIDVRVQIDRDSGDYETFRRWQVVESYEAIEPGLDFSKTHVLLEDAKQKNTGIEVGDFIEEPLESIGFGLDRPLFKLEHFERFKKNTVTIQLTEKLNKVAFSV